MSWAVTGDVGERGPAINLNAFEWLHNIQPKTFFNTVVGTGPCLKEHGPAIDLRVFEKLHNFQTKNLFKTVKWTGPCLGEHDQPFISTWLKVFLTPRRKDFSTPRNELGRDSGCWGARPSHQLECFRNGCITSRRKGFSIPWWHWGVFGGARPSHWFACFSKASQHPDEKLVQNREMIWTVFGGARPAEQPFSWKFLKVCITSKRKPCLTPWNEMGRDKGCWGTRPSYQLDCF